MAFHVEKFKKGEELSLDQVREVQLEILKYFARYCEEHKLRFFLAGGTSLGAVRHQGYVPWDDDVDIVMPRPDWETFIHSVDLHFGPYEIRSYMHTPDIHPRPLFRVVDPRYFMQINHIQKFLPLWIDVLPLDGLPSDRKEREKHYKQSQRLKWTIARSYSNFFKEKNRIKRVIKYVVCTPLRMIGPNYFVRKLDALGKKYDYESAEYVGSFTAGYGLKEAVHKSVFDSAIMASFCGYRFPIPAGYHEVLSSVYGDYMQLPPEKKRKVHMIGAWKNALLWDDSEASEEAATDESETVELESEEIETEEAETEAE